MAFKPTKFIQLWGNFTDQEMKNWKPFSMPDVLSLVVGAYEKGKEDNLCDACAGTGKPISGLACMCNGTGKMSEAAIYLRERMVLTEQTLEKTTDRLNEAVRALSKISLGERQFSDGVESMHIAREALEKIKE